MKKIELKPQVELRRCFLFSVFCFLSSDLGLRSFVFCLLSSIFLFGDTWVQTTTSDFNTAGSAPSQTEVINDTVQIAAQQTDWWKPAENWPSAMSAWQYRKAITINNSGVSPLSDYQVKVENPVYDETGLVGSWHFEEPVGTTTGTVADSSGSGNNGTMNNFVSPKGVVANGRFGNALSFDGTNDFVQIPDSSVWDFASDFAIEAWFKGTPPSSAYSTIAGRITGSGGAWSDIDWVLAIWSNGKILAQTSNNGAGGSSITGLTNVGNNQWHHIVYRKNGNNFNVYVDGNIDGSETVSLTVRNSANPVRIGWGYDTTVYTSGLIDEVRVYNRALSADEIAAHYNAKAKLNYGDIIFTGNSGTEFPYWMEKDGTFWVKVAGTDSIPVGLSNVYMYYGNASATSASSTATTFVREISGLVGSWPMNESSGNTADKSGNGYNGTLTNASYATGKFGNGISFGGNSYVTTGDINQLDGVSKFTFLTWVKFNSFSGTSADHIGLIAKHVSATSGLSFSVYGTLRYPESAVRNGANTGTYGPNDTFATGQWYHVVLVYDGTQAVNTDRIRYYNNTVDVTGTFTGTIPTTTSSTSVNVVFGSYPETGSLPGVDDNLNGMMDEVHIFNTALSIAEVSDVYNNIILSTLSYPGKALIRKYNSPEPTTTVGSEITQTSEWQDRQLITVTNNETASALSSGYSVKADVDLDFLRNAGNLNNDLSDLRVVAKNKTSGEQFELDRDIVKGHGINLSSSSSQYISILDSNSWNFGNSDFTVEAWIKPSNISVYNAIIGQSSSSSLYQWLCIASSGKLHWDSNNGVSALGPVMDGNTTLTVGGGYYNGWYHVAVTRNGPSWNLWVNGQSDATATNSDTLPDIGSALNIGSLRPGYVAFDFNGLIDEVRISNNVRYSANFVPQQTPFVPDANTVGLYHLDNDAGDASGNGNNGTLNGSPYYTEGKVVRQNGVGREVSVPDTGLVGLWRLNESSAIHGAAIISATGSNNGIFNTNNGTVNKAVNGKLNGAITFDGTDDYVSIADSEDWNFGNGDFSISIWIKTSDTSEEFILSQMGTGGGSNVNCAVVKRSGGTIPLRFIASSTGTGYPVDIQTTAVIEDNIWHHIVVTRSGSTFSLYVDCILKGTTTFAGLLYNSTAPLNIGAGNNQTSYTFTGNVDETFVYKGRCLNFTEIRSLYNFKNEVWFKTQSAINASSTSEASGSHSYYFYYKNLSTAAAPENKVNIYQFFDDFEDGNANGWYWNTGSAFAVKTDVKQGAFSYGYGSAGGRMDYPLSLSAPYVMEADVYMTSNTGDSMLWGTEKIDANYIAAIDVDTGVYKYFQSAAWLSTGIAPTLSNWVRSKIVYKSSTQADFYENDKLLKSDAVISGTPAKLMIGAYNAGTRFDNIKVRLYTAAEPSCSFSTEEPIPDPYYSTGTFTSASKDTGDNSTTVDSVAWTSAGAGTITMQVRAGNTDPPTSSYEDVLVSGNAPSSPVSGRYIQYKATFTGDGTSSDPVLTDVTVTYTVPIVPPVDSVSCDKLTNNWYSTATFTFVNSNPGFGAQINKYYYAWGNTASYTFTLAEPVWNSSTPPATAPQLLNTSTSDGSWYFHYLPYSSTNTAGTAQDIGPFKYDGTVPPSIAITSPAANASISTSTADFSWDAVTDLSGVSYTLQLDNYTSFSSPVINKTNLADTTYTLSGTGAEILIGNSTYYWRVIAVDGAGNMSYTANPSYYKFTTTSTIPQMINESTGESYATIQDAVNSASTTDGDTISIEDTIAHTESITLSKDVTLQNGILSPTTGFAVTGQGTAGGEILRNCVVTYGGISNLALGENLTIFSPDSAVLVIENSHLVNCLIEFGAEITNSTLENCDIAVTSDYFVSASTMDFRLKSTAVSAIDQGINLSVEFSTDIDGNTKGVDVLDVINFDAGAWDIGAYEFNSTSFYLTNSGDSGGTGGDGDSGGSGGTSVIASSIYTTPSALIFYADYDKPGEETASFTVFKNGDTDVNWTVSDDADWLTLDTASGSTATAMEVQATADSAGLSAGEHTATITITAPDAGNSPVALPVTLLVFSSESGSALYVSPASLSYSAGYGSSAQSTKSLVIYTNGIFGLDWSAQDDIAWLSLTPSSGNTLQSVNMEVTMIPSGLMAGVHTGTITITSPGAVNSPVSVPVTLVITDNTIPGGQDNGNSGQVTGDSNVVSLTKPALLSPLDGLLDVYPAPVLSWDADTDVTSLLQISLNAEFTEFLVSKLVDIQAYQTTGVKYGTVYYWRVKTFKGNAVSDWSDTWWFRMDSGSEKAAKNGGPATGCFLGRIRNR
ncbi:MAG: DUF2341 domain-containing protein [Planctomycetes bacterium]|nr:DUF2341 domain-containing protein [Planctomycetota bacterium]